MSWCTLLFLMRLWKCGVSILYIRFRSKVGLSTSSWFLLTQSPNHWSFLSVPLRTLCPMPVPLLPRCFWVETASLSWRVSKSQVGRKLLRQRIGQFSELISLELLALFHNRLRNCLCLHSILFQRLGMIVVRPRKFSQHLFICPPLGSLTPIIRHLISTSSNWINLCWGCFELLVDFHCYLRCSDRLQKVVLVELLLDSFCRQSCYPVDAKLNLHKSASSLRAQVSDQKLVVYTRELLSSALDCRGRKILSVGCHRLGQQLKEKSL